MLRNLRGRPLGTAATTIVAQLGGTTVVGIGLVATAERVEALETLLLERERENEKKEAQS